MDSRINSFGACSRLSASENPNRALSAPTFSLKSFMAGMVPPILRKRAGSLNVSSRTFFAMTELGASKPTAYGWALSKLS